MEAFCSKVDYNGKQIKKYFRDTKREKAGELTCEMLENDGYRTPIRKEKKKIKFAIVERRPHIPITPKICVRITR